MLCLAPFFFSIDLCACSRMVSAHRPVFAYFGVLNTTQFNGRTRALNGFLAGAGPIFAALLLGVVHDRLPCNRRKRAFCGLALVATFVMVTWGGGLAFQLGFTRQTPVVPKDWEDPRAAGPIALLMSCKLQWCRSLIDRLELRGSHARHGVLHPWRSHR
jgi:hypothetical protein